MDGSWISPVILESDVVRLRPLEAKDADALVEAASDGELWRLWVTNVPDAATVGEYVQTAIDLKRSRGDLPFVVEEAATGVIIGTTRYINADPVNRRLEIGYTWYARRVQRTPVNTHCKYLLLRHAFESLDCIAVEFRTHRMNRASRAAIERLGAHEDGVLRNHRILPDGTYRDTVVYSILESEWPAVSSHLQRQIER